jgi:hypothetical protein
VINYLLTYRRGKKINKIFKIFLVIFVAIQPLHSYTTITISNSDESNGFEYLHAELCGTKYTGAVSHTQKISDLLDKINTAFITDMAVDCVCCEAIDIAHDVLIQLSGSHILISTELVGIHRNFYAPNVKILIPYTNQVRAPPIV